MTSLHRHLRRMAAAAALGGMATVSAACSSSPGHAVGPAAKTTVTATITAAPTATASASPTQPATATGSPAPTPTPTSTGLAPCSTSALKVAIGQGNGAAGSSYYPLDFSNVSGTACTLFGYPGVSFVTGIGGRQIGHAASRNPAFTSESVTMPAGGVVHATLQVVDADNFPNPACHRVTAHWLKIYPPNQTAPLYLSFTALACTRRARSVSILAVEAVRPGSS